MQEERGHCDRELSSLHDILDDTDSYCHCHTYIDIHTDIQIFHFILCCS